MSGLVQMRSRESITDSIIVALVGDPELLFLDEPTTGLHLSDIGLLMAIIDRLVDARGRRPAPISVYRALDFLMELGLVHRIVTTDSSAPARETQRAIVLGKANLHELAFGITKIGRAHV